MRSSYVSCRIVAHLQSGQGVEYLSAAIVQHQYTYVASVVMVPQRIHVVEEAQVAYKDKVQLA